MVSTGHHVALFNTLGLFTMFIWWYRSIFLRLYCALRLCRCSKYSQYCRVLSLDFTEALPQLSLCPPLQSGPVVTSLLLSRRHQERPPSLAVCVRRHGGMASARKPSLVVRTVHREEERVWVGSEGGTSLRVTLDSRLRHLCWPPRPGLLVVCWFCPTYRVLKIEHVVEF